MVNKMDLTKYKDCTPFTEQRLITDLVAELAIALNDKANLESENAKLKLECQELKHKLVDYERIWSEEKNCLTEVVKKSQETIQEKEISLAQKDVQHLQEKKKFLMEINDLKAEFYKQKDLFGKKELKLAKELELLRTKTLTCNNNCNTHKEIAESFQSKYIKYKAKVKYAIGIINTLTAALENYKQKPILFNKESQTESRNPKVYASCTSSCSLDSQCAVHNDDTVIAELFFKPHPSSNEIETIFFMPSNNSTDTFQENEF